MTLTEKRAVKAHQALERAEKRMIRAYNAWLAARAKVIRYANRIEKGLGGAYDVREGKL